MPTKLPNHKAKPPKQILLGGLKAVFWFPRYLFPPEMGEKRKANKLPNHKAKPAKSEGNDEIDRSVAERHNNDSSGSSISTMKISSAKDAVALFRYLVVLGCCCLLLIGNVVAEIEGQQLTRLIPVSASSSSYNKGCIEPVKQRAWDPICYEADVPKTILAAPLSYEHLWEEYFSSSTASGKQSSSSNNNNKSHPNDDHDDKETAVNIDSNQEKEERHERHLHHQYHHRQVDDEDKDNMDVCSFIAKAIYADFGIFDIALINQGTCASGINIEGGDKLFDHNSVGKLLPYRNELVSIRLKGKDIQKAISNGIQTAIFGGNAGAYPKTFGIKYDWDFDYNSNISNKSNQTNKSSATSSATATATATTANTKGVGVLPTNMAGRTKGGKITTTTVTRYMKSSNTKTTATENNKGGVLPKTMEKRTKGGKITTTTVTRYMRSSKTPSPPSSDPPPSSSSSSSSSSSASSSSSKSSSSSLIQISNPKILTGYNNCQYEVLQPEKHYTVLTNWYLSQGNDGYKIFQNPTDGIKVESPALLKLGVTETDSFWFHVHTTCQVETNYKTKQQREDELSQSKLTMLYLVDGGGGNNPYHNVTNIM